MYQYVCPTLSQRSLLVMNLLPSCSSSLYFYHMSIHPVQYMHNKICILNQGNYIIGDDDRSVLYTPDSR